MIKRSKRYKSSTQKLSSVSSLSLEEAVQVLSSFDKAKFDETVELSVSLAVDPKQSSQAVRGTVNLPHGSGKNVRVLVFTQNPDEALSSGADFAGLEDLVKKLKMDGSSLMLLLQLLVP